MKSRIVGLESEYGVTFTPRGGGNLTLEKVMYYLFETITPYSSYSNSFLTNGARFYQDTGSHPEYSTPECDDLHDLVRHDKAGERILENSLLALEERFRKEGFRGKIFVYKNNTDTVGNTYGCHENYLVDRRIDFARYSELLIPFLVTRQIYTGAGKVLRTNGEVHYCLSQRAQHIHYKLSCSTTSSRPIINTRDEPHADAEKYRRLHIIVGDSNMSEFTTYLKVGATALVLQVIEEGGLPSSLQIEDPVRAIKEISRDAGMRRKIRLEGGKELTALEIQRQYWEWTHRHFERRGKDATVTDLLDRWEAVMDALETDPLRLRRHIDWVIKKSMVEAYMAERRCGWDDPRIALMDLQYHDVRQDRGLYYLLSQRGFVEQIASEEEIQRAISTPPQTTRAKIRGDFIRHANRKNKSYSVDWSYVRLRGYEDRTIFCLDPFTSEDSRVEKLIASF
jgi:proteasome accessory factor A